MGWIKNKRAEANAKDAKAKESVSEMRKRKQLEQSGGQMNPDLARQLNAIQGMHGKRGNF